MGGSISQNKEVAAFLGGNPRLVQEIRSTVNGVVRTFHFTEKDLHEELVQEAMSKIVANLREGRFRGESSLKTYVHNVAKYTCIGFLRRRRQDTEIDFDAVPSTARWSGPEESLIHLEEHMSNLRAFAALPRECQNLFRLIFLEGLSYDEVAERLGISEGAVKSRVRRCRLLGRETAQRESSREAKTLKIAAAGHALHRVKD